MEEELARQNRLHFSQCFLKQAEGNQEKRLKSITFDPVKSRVEAF